jgi:hypothetical protein
MHILYAYIIGETGRTYTPAWRGDRGGTGDHNVRRLLSANLKQAISSSTWALTACSGSPSPARVHGPVSMGAIVAFLCACMAVP